MSLPLRAPASGPARETLFKPTLGHLTFIVIISLALTLFACTFHGNILHPMEVQDLQISIIQVEERPTRNVKYVKQCEFS